MMEFSIATKEDFEALIENMNYSFDKDELHHFKHILPKFYFKDNDKMSHFIAKDDGKIVSSVGLYDMKMISKYSSLKCGIVGGVSTNPECRGKGYMSKLLNNLLSFAKENEYDILLLTGDRTRYSHFNFEQGGRSLIGTVSKRSNLNPKPFEMHEATSQDDYDLIQKLYFKQNQHILRGENIADHLRTWNSKPFVVSVNNKFIGYFCLGENKFIHEINFINGFENEILAAALNDNDYVEIRFSMDYYNNCLIDKFVSYRISYDALYNILNLKKVMQYLNVDFKYYDELSNKNNSELIRDLLGSIAFDSKYSSFNIFTSQIDQG